MNTIEFVFSAELELSAWSFSLLQSGSTEVRSRPVFSEQLYNRREDD